MPSSFLHPMLLWGLPIIAAPVLIHLINMLRHRRVDWAAMEFLLLSQKKNRTWVMLKQFLLLLLRILAVALVVFIVAQPLLRNQWGNLLGGERTHHIVLLDDSFSMSDRWADTDAFSEAKRVVERLGAAVARQTQNQAFTLLRFSQVGQFERGTQPDILKQTVGPDFTAKLNETLSKLKVSQTAAGPIGPIQAIGQLLGSSDGERRVVYLISDFRARDWNEPTDVREALRQLNESGAEVHLVNCIDKERPNLAITSLAPADGIRAAGVQWFMEVTVQNFGTEVVREAPVLLSEDGHARPAATIAEIPPGRAVKERFPVNFTTAGPHQVTARLESDSVAADNYRYCAMDLPADMPVLLIDGDAQARDARFLNWALSPGGAVRTGIRPQIELPRYLSTKPLSGFHVIAVANVDRLEKSAIDALEQFVAGGGGVAFFLGDRCQGKFFNDSLYREGQGLFPAPLGRETELLVDRLEPAPDVQVEDHFIFRVFAEKRNTFLQTVTVQRYFSVAEGWQPPPDSTVRVVSRLRNGAPLVIERGFGKGRVMAFLSTAAPVWNNWARNPSFVVAMQDLQAYLAKRTSDESSLLVGSPLELTLDPSLYRPQVRFVTPDQVATAAVDAVRKADGTLGASLADTRQAGYYEVRLTRSDESAETRQYAVNVDAGEGNLAALGAEQLTTRLEGIKYQYEQAAAFQLAAVEMSGYNLGETLLYLLIVLLIGEQLLAWSASYHPAPRPALMVQGGAA